MELKFDVDEKEANEILLSLSYRCKQDGIRNTPKENEIIELGKKLSRMFERKFNWIDSRNKFRSVFEYYLKKKVTVRIRGNG